VRRVFDRGDAELDLSLEGDSLARSPTLQALHGALACARDPVEHSDEVTRVRVSFLARRVLVGKRR
jgi:hypothetical protein